MQLQSQHAAGDSRAIDYLNDSLKGGEPEWAVMRQLQNQSAPARPQQSKQLAYRSFAVVALAGRLNQQAFEPRQGIGCHTLNALGPHQRLNLCPWVSCMRRNWIAVSVVHCASV